MMQKVVLEGTGRKAVLEGYSSAGKTGTAQKVDPATGAYSKTKYIGSFAGFAPFQSQLIPVAAGQIKRVDVAMAIETAQQNVVVTDDSAPAPAVAALQAAGVEVHRV